MIDKSIPYYSLTMYNDTPYSYPECALPEGFEEMEYMDFLKQRRILMAKIIKKAYERL